MYVVQAREVGDSLFLISDWVSFALSHASRALCSLRVGTWGSASLHPRLYAIPPLRGLGQPMINLIRSSFSLLERLTNKV